MASVVTFFCTKKHMRRPCFDSEMVLLQLLDPGLYPRQFHLLILPQIHTLASNPSLSSNNDLKAYLTQ